jgi:hypothetical protein
MKTMGLIVVLLAVSLCGAADEPVPEVVEPVPEPAPEAEAEAPTRRYDVEQLHHQIRQVVQRHFPKATSHRLNGKIHFEHDTRVFLIHEQLKTGEWQDPWEVRGPRRDGVLGDIEVAAGEYVGAAMTPQDINNIYFIHRVMTPYSKRLDAHVRVDVRYTKWVPAGFLDQLSAVVNDFDKFVEVAKDVK